MSSHNPSSPSDSLPAPKVRRALFSELVSMSRVLAAAFHDNELFGDLMHPHRSQYPDDMSLYFLRSLRLSWWDWRHVLLVTVENDGKGGETISGVMELERYGDEGRSKWGWGLWWADPRNLAKPLASLFNSIHSLAFPDRAADPTRLTILEDSHHFIEHHWTGAHAESWYIFMLGVHPDFQGKGRGKALVQQGLGLADKEGVCASVISAEGKEGFYRKLGLDNQVGTASEGAGNPMRGVQGGYILFREVITGN